MLRKLQQTVFFQLHFSVFLWGFTGILGALISLPELPLVCWRMALATLGFYFLVRMQGQAIRLSRKDFFQLAGIGVLLGIHWVLFFGAIALSNVSVTLVCMASTGLMTSLLEPLFFRGRVRWFEVLLGIGVLCGIWLILQADVDNAIGIAVALCSAMLASMHAVLTKRLVDRFDTSVLNLVEIGGGWLFLTVVGLPIWYTFQTDLPASALLPTGWDFLWLALLAFVCTNYAYALSLKALRHVTAFVYVLAVNMEPIYSIVLAFFILGEKAVFNLYFLAGTCIVMASVFLYPVIERRFRPYALPS